MSWLIYSFIGRSFFQSILIDSPKEDLTTEEQINRLRNLEGMLTKKTNFLEKKIQSELEAAKKHGTSNKKGKCIT